MKINIHLFYTTILFILIVFVSIEFHNNNILESRINSLNKNSVNFNSEKTFKEDYYITQQSKDTNLLLVLFPILVGAFGFFTYTNVTERYKSRFDTIEIDYNNHKAEWMKNHNMLIELETELNYQIGAIFSDRASKSIQTNFNNGLMLSMCAMEKFAMSASAEKSRERKELTLKLIHIELDCLDSMIDDKDIFEVTDLDFYIYKDRIERIIKVLDNNSMTIFNRITSKIRIV
jgi:hypothetical protein